MERLKTVDELAYTDLDGLTQFITEVRRGRFADPTAMAKSTLLVSLLKSAVSTALIHRYPSPNMQDLTGVAFSGVWLIVPGSLQIVFLYLLLKVRRENTSCSTRLYYLFFAIISIVFRKNRHKV